MKQPQGTTPAGRGWFLFAPGPVTISSVREGYVRVSDQLVWVESGRDEVAAGGLRALRRDLGVSRNSMAYLLQTTVGMYTSWETNHAATVRPATANRIGRFCYLARKQLESLKEHGITLNSLIPLDQAITQLGVPQELLMKMYRRGDFEAEDLGVLGLWLYEEDLDEIRGML